MTLLDPAHLLATFGPLGLFVVLFAETGLLVGFFLPGDSLLFSAGILAATPAAAAAHLPLRVSVPVAAAGALLGAQTGFLIGRHAGPPLLTRGGRSVHEGVDRARRALDRYGLARAVVLARFVPVVRTLINPLAGALEVPARTFTTWQVVGGLVWTVGVELAGFWLGRRIPGVEQYLLPIVLGAVVLSLVPMGVQLVRHRRS